MKKFITILLIAICALGLAACDNNIKPESNAEKEKTPIEAENAADENISLFESEEIDFSNVSYQVSETAKDAKLKEAVKNVLQEQYGIEADDQVKYYFNKIDLNGDQKLETFVFLTGSIVSGTGGSTAIIFEGDEDNYKLAADFSLVRNPIIVSNEKTNGWNDLIMHVAGGGIEAFYAQLKFDGETYPANPSVEPEVKAGTVVEGTAIIADDIAKNPGMKLQ